METGLLTLLVLAGFLYAAIYMKHGSRHQLWLAAILLGVAFLTRNESLLLAGLVFGALSLQIWRSSRD